MTVWETLGIPPGREPSTAQANAQLLSAEVQGEISEAIDDTESSVVFVIVLNQGNAGGLAVLPLRPGVRWGTGTPYGARWFRRQ